MKKNLDCRIVRITVLLVCLAYSNLTVANVPPSPEILELEATQDAQDVVVDVGIVRDYYRICELSRMDIATGESVILSTTMQMTVVQSHEIEDCAWVSDVTFPGHDAWCADNPESCSDCDGDGIAECKACEWVYYFTYRDACVPPGSYTYSMTYGNGIVEESVELNATDISHDICAADTLSTDTDSTENTGTDVSKGSHADDNTDTETGRESDAEADMSEEGSRGGCSAAAGHGRGLLSIMLHLF